ncbi:excinuclease ABC subunit UvrA [Spirochaeta africana]|uniref:UvrABC system protein A n=1 Tax=Spirochaeta africana (strain ATCC 700263 / DSM 8902 / Z-7692) TaxID=889378 RepID=H9UJK4_SPIAZ|nr:excinuclease ABC subunit UvrA [Spirochaeta africana]AFG37697.1 excinuclease ABC, A subunit [Spirochaeta africana DSM 8902]
MKNLIVKGAREHNLQNIDIELPRDSLIVVSGLSGSGKSSLAFDTIFAEGQRRYVESLSAYARQFLGRMDKPDVDYIEGLSPAISIEQKTTNRNPRSTVGTVTEIYDYYRLLWARIGVPHDPVTGAPLVRQTVDEIINAILELPEGSRISILAPVIQGKKGQHKKVLEDARRAGFVRAMVNGSIHQLEDPLELDKQKKHSIEIVVDRLKLNHAGRSRIAEAVETALEAAGGRVWVTGSDPDGTALDREFSEHYRFADESMSLPELQPRLFSFNSPFGACPACSGLGMTLEYDLRKIIPDPALSFEDHGLAPYNPGSNWHRSKFAALADHLGFSLDTPYEELPDHIQHALLYGTEEAIEFSYVNRNQTGRFEYQEPFPGVFADLQRRYREASSERIREWLEGFMSQRPCTACDGRRLRHESLSVLVQGKSIIDATRMSVADSLDFFASLELSENQQQISSQILKEIRDRLHFLHSVGLSYLTLDRMSGTLSGGEAQRIRLATQIGSSLVGVLYILDEPSIGLHQRDNDRLIKTLEHLRNIGNTLIVVEHDEQTLRTADHIVDLGPGAGVHGGRVVAQGTVEQICAVPESLTGQYLSGTLRIDIPEQRRSGSGKELVIRGACEHNLKNIDAAFPLHALSIITGVSGSGKSTLLSDIMYPALANRLNRASMEVGSHAGIEGIQNLDKVINIDQSPIGRTPRSNPATYVGVYTAIRELFAAIPEAKARGYKPGRFSFNVKGGRCENCQGAGTIKIEMHFLPDVYVTCDVCNGKRFNTETLEIAYKGKTIYDVLEMTIEEGLAFFGAIPAITRKLQTLHDVGLDYIHLGQSALTLSGGEAQRVKLALELSKRSTGKTIYLLDEPTTGLHFADVKKLMEVLQVLVDQGNTVILIEHNLDVIAQADYILDLGPEGGDGGGTVVVAGPPEVVAAHHGSYTGQYLREHLETRP